MKTKKELLDAGATWVEKSGYFDADKLLLDGVLWEEKPSENGNGWFAGDSGDTDNLLYVEA